MGGQVVVRQRWRWTVELAALGALVPAAHGATGLALAAWSIPGGAWLAWSLLWPLVAVGCGLGAVLGVVAPPFLEWVRGRVSLWLLTLLASLLGATWAWATLWLVGVHDPMAMLAAMAFGAVGGGLVFLPYTAAAVLGLPRTPILVVVLAVAAVLGLFV